MNQTAQHLASQGRYGDSMLVHMSPQEVSGLQSLARNNGTTMTINPSTGLPEAFSLRNLLPMIAGFALGPAGLGLSALQAGMITGGLGALATGSLGKGVLMGLGAAGGAGLGGSAANLASPAATSGAGATSSTLGASGMGGAGTGVTVPSSAMQGSSFGLPSPTSTVGLNAKNLALPPMESGAYGLTSPAPTSINAYAPPPSALAPTTTSAYSQLPAASSGSLTAPSSMTTLSPAPSISERFATNFGRAMEGGGKAFSSSDAAMDFLGSNKMNLAMAAAPSAIPETPRLPRSESYIRPYSLDVENLSDAPVSPTGVEEERLRYRYTAGTPYRAAQGGIIAFAEGGNTTDGFETYTNPAMMTPPQYMQVPPFAGIEGYSYAEGGETKRRDVRRRIDRMDDPYTFAAYQSGRGLYDAALQNFAEGGLSNVPRFLSGGGDGMSDSIPATINNRQPARLADGEFVIPADVVSHLGNGSSKAGAKQLYSMMDRVRTKRTGKKKQAPAVNPKKMMPA